MNNYDITILILLGILLAIAGIYVEQTVNTFTGVFIMALGGGVIGSAIVELFYS